LLILVAQYERAAGPSERQSIYRLYLRHTDRINNWDLVDLSAPNIVGAYLFDHDRKPLYRLARSSDLWERRIAMLATFYFIRKDDFKDALGIANILVDDAHDLIHKAVGWMLREVGKRDKAVEEKFLRKHCRTMPRTMLRYAIEKFPEDERQAYLKGEP
jgi:3-methyladenine DNA glycosylase AlkD